MSNKKIIFIAVFLAVLAIGVGWFWSRQNLVSVVPGPVPSQSARIIFGDKNAPVLIEEYTNFLCSACANFAQNVLPKIEANYVKTGKAKIVFYVLGPQELGQAAYCADKAGKFTEYHDYLFAHQSEITSEQAVLDAAVSAGLEAASFNNCYNSQGAKDIAQAWAAQAQDKGVSATPTFFINGEKIEGVQPYDDFAKVIEQKLQP